MTPGRTANPAPLLQARGIGRQLGTAEGGFTLAVEEFTVAAGDAIAVVGPSGCGKSTLLGLLALALRPVAIQADAVLSMAGTDAWALWQRGGTDALAGLRARCLGYVPQTAALMSFLTLRTNIALPQLISGRQDKEYLLWIAARLGIGNLLDRMPSQVSVGQRQRAAVARALAHRPSIILADEPTASVHPSQADEVLALLRSVAFDARCALVITTHDIGRVEAAGYITAPCTVSPNGAASTMVWAGTAAT